MDITVEEFSNGREMWDGFVKGSPNSDFMQSYNWSVFQEEGLERKTYRLGFKKGNELVAVCACYEINQTFGKYIYAMRGPVLKSLDSQLYEEVLKKLTSFFEKKGYLFLKIDPAIEKKEDISEGPLSLGFKKCINYVQPETPWYMDLVGDTQEQLMEWCKENGMSKNYPTYIRKARKMGIKVRFSKDISDWKVFAHYLRKSSNKKDFAIQDSTYYLKQLKYLGEYDEVRLAIAETEEGVLAMLVLSFFGDTVSCLYSAQTETQRKARGPMYLRWECMLQAQREGFKHFNSLDVLPDEKYIPSSSRYGYSMFKRSFGGYLIRYERCMDYPYDRLRYCGVRVLDYYRKLRYYRDR
jgi:lipid II:glycine glycyltransferase (peptidoglycan interpeptide bridge formation enzyme)